MRVGYAPDIGLSDRFLDALAERCGEPPIEIGPGGAPEGVSCLILGWKHHAGCDLADRHPELRLILLRATSRDRVDEEGLACRGIAVRSLRRYGDEGTSEFVVREVLDHFGLGRGGRPRREIAGKTVGLIGAGVIARRVARALSALDADVVYTRRRRVLGDDMPHARLVDRDELLTVADVISLHGPPHAQLISLSDLSIAHELELLVITTLGLPLPVDDLRSWCAQGGRAVLDLVAGSEVETALEPDERIVVRQVYAARTAESVERVEGQLLAHLDDYLSATAASA